MKNQTKENFQRVTAICLTWLLHLTIIIAQSVKLNSLSFQNLWLIKFKFVEMMTQFKYYSDCSGYMISSTCKMKMTLDKTCFPFTFLFIYTFINTNNLIIGAPTF